MAVQRTADVNPSRADLPENDVAPSPAGSAAAETPAPPEGGGTAEEGDWKGEGKEVELFLCQKGRHHGRKEEV